MSELEWLMVFYFPAVFFINWRHNGHGDSFDGDSPSLRIRIGQARERFTKWAVRWRTLKKHRAWKD